MSRRALPRRRMRLPLRLHNVANNQRCLAWAKDFHPKGLLIDCLPAGSEIGEFIEVEFTRGPEDEPSVGRVQRFTDDGMGGVSLARVPALTQAFLETLCLEHAEVRDYQLEAHIGHGGMGQVFLARGSDGAPLVIKRLLPQYAHDHAAIDMFTTEAELLRRCHHRGLPRFVEAAEWHGSFYLAMEWIDGEALDALLAHSGPVAPSVARGVIVQLLDALEHLHSLRLDDGSILDVSHGDISPRNVIVDRKGRVVLLDLGTCWSTLTPRPEGYEIMGTAPYMAPDLLLGEMPSLATDLWSLGVLYYELIAGFTPFRRSSVGETMTAIRTRSCLPLHEVAGMATPQDSALFELLTTATERRPRSCGEILAAACKMSGGVASEEVLPRALSRPMERSTGRRSLLWRDRD